MVHPGYFYASSRQNIGRICKTTAHLADMSHSGSARWRRRRGQPLRHALRRREGEGQACTRQISFSLCKFPQMNVPIMTDNVSSILVGLELLSELLSSDRKFCPSLRVRLHDFHRYFSSASHFSVITLNLLTQLWAIKKIFCPVSSSINRIKMEAAQRRGLSQRLAKQEEPELNFTAVVRSKLIKKSLQTRAVEVRKLEQEACFNQVLLQPIQLWKQN